MNPFTFQVPSNILFQSVASAKLPGLVAELGAKRIMLVTDRGVRQARLAEDAMKQTRLLVNNPREVAYADAYAIYSEALDGRLRQAA
jgi:alcohol dehydrogenase class IV